MADYCDEDPLFNLYRRLLDSRRSSPALQGGGYESLDAADDCFVYFRQQGDERLLVTLNFAGEPRQLAIAGESHGRLEFSTHLDRVEKTALSGLPLRPHEGAIVRL